MRGAVEGGGFVGPNARRRLTESRFPPVGGRLGLPACPSLVSEPSKGKTRATRSKTATSPNQ
jgi:hypothetical protein